MDKTKINIFLILASAIVLTFVIGITYFIFRYRQRQLLHEKNIEDLHNNFTREILTSKVEIKEATLKEVASELHDNVGHLVTMGLMNLNLVPPVQQQEDETKLNEARLQLNKAIDSLRDISKAMNSDVLLQAGLTEAINQQLNRLRKSSFYQIEFLIEGIAPVLKDEQHALIIFRIVQESITNIIRHSKAKQIDVHIKNNGHVLLISIRDNGHGFPVKETMQSHNKGSGLRNMFTRAAMIGAELNIDSSGSGTLSTLTYPLT